jgi:hypothetical protein
MPTYSYRFALMLFFLSSLLFAHDSPSDSVKRG